jgi:sorting nexin-8
VKNLLPVEEVPEAYVDVFDRLVHEGERLGAGVTLGGVRKVLKDSGVGLEVQGRILGVVLPEGEDEGRGMGRGEFNVLLALVGLAQESEDVTLDGVDERRKSMSVSFSLFLFQWGWMRRIMFTRMGC